MFGVRRQREGTMLEQRTWPGSVSPALRSWAGVAPLAPLRTDEVCSAHSRCIRGRGS